MPSLNQFQQFVLGLLSPQTVETKETQLVNGLLGINGEAGEAADLYKKARYHGKDFDKHKLALELGDILFYVASTADAIDYTLEDIALLNMEKLMKRYPSGKFTTQDSLEKKDENKLVGVTSGNGEIAEITLEGTCVPGAGMPQETSPDGVK